MRRIGAWVFGVIVLVLWMGGLCSYAYAKEAPVVYVYNWARYMPERLLKEFEKETGIHVVYDVFDSVEALEAKLFARSGYDVVFPSAWPVFERGVSVGLFQKLDYKKLPHAKDFYPRIQRLLGEIKDGPSYGVPYLWGTAGLGYDLEELRRAGLEKAADTWGLLFSPVYRKALSACRVSLLDSPTDVFQAALIFLGYQPRKATREQWAKAIAVVRSMRPVVTLFDSFQQTDNLLNGTITILQGFSSYVNIARDRGRRLRKPKAIRYVLPKEGAVMWIDMMAIPKDAPHPDNAHRLIDFILRPRNMAMISNIIRAANPLASAQKWVDPELLANESVFPPAQVMDRLYPEVVPSPQLRRFLSLEWLKVKSNYKGD